MKRVTILVAENAPTRLGVRLALGSDFEICAEADNAPDAVVEAQRSAPDACLIGLDIPGGGLSAVRHICRALPSTAVIVLAGISNADDLLAAVRAGAVGYVPGPLNAVQLRPILRAVVAKEAVIPRKMVLDLLIELRGAEAGGDERLTGREAQVLGMLRRGHSTATIAGRLAISQVTVRRHVSELMRKVGVKHREELVLQSAG